MGGWTSKAAVWMAGACALAVAGCANTAPAAETPALLAGPAAPAPASAAFFNPGARWLAGDHHVHSEFSVGWDKSKDPPTPIIAGDARYPIEKNVLHAETYGLSWMVSTDHGGPNHSKLNREQAYPEVLKARRDVPGVILFYGMEFDTPGADHSSLIIPHTHDEADRLQDLESRFSKREPWPADPSWDTEARMIEALKAMREEKAPPVLIANHPSRSATGVGEYGKDDPAELRGWNDTAPNVAVGMAGAPGHQAKALTPDGLNPDGVRGSYDDAPTMGGFDQMTAIVGGFWDSMLGEGRRWWITANSDSHFNWREGGGDFWPGEYSKTYVFAEKDYDEILGGLRNGRIFVTTGDLVSELYVTASSGGAKAGIGGEVLAASDDNRDVNVEIRFRQSGAPNAHGDRPEVKRVDLIVGEVTGKAADPNTDHNPTTRVAARFDPKDWRMEGEFAVITYVLKDLPATSYLRVRGTSTDELEPEPDPRGEDPWKDLWFYSNPIFVRFAN